MKARKLPQADDDFAKTASSSTRSTSSATTRDALGEMKRARARRRCDRVLDAMIDSIDVDIPDTLIDDETEHRVAHAGERAQRPV